MNLYIIILAAGQGKRMNSALPKVLHHLAGKPLLAHVIKTAQAMRAKKIYIVYGNGGKEVLAAIDSKSLNWIEQKRRLGTAHAVLKVMPFIPDSAQVLILYGDVPLISPATLRDLIIWTDQRKLGIVVAELPNPFGFGRIIRDARGMIKKIIEEKDASDEEQAIKEINTGIMLSPALLLKSYLPKIKPNNFQKEYYLTDMISLAVVEGQEIVDIKVPHAEEVMGVNDKVQLAKLERFYQMQQAESLMKQGVTLFDPARFDLRGELTLGRDVVIDINVIIEGEVKIGDNSQIGTNCFLRDVSIGKNVMIKSNCVIEASVIADNCIIGPFAHIRPESQIDIGAHIGNFVEIKKCRIGKASKVNHLTYLGDSIVGKKVNVGAGTITCNYDGAIKHQTIIEDGAFIGSDSQLIAPVHIGKKAYIGSGSTIVADAPAGKLTLARARQVTVKKWHSPKQVKTKGKTKISSKK